MSNMPEVMLKAGREKSIRRRHPWIFSGAVARVDGAPPSGSTVRLVSQSREFLAYAAWSPCSQIRLRIWSYDENQSIDAAFVRQRVARSIELRRQLKLLDKAIWLAVVVCLLVSLVRRQLLLLEALTCEERTCSV